MPIIIKKKKKTPSLFLQNLKAFDYYDLLRCLQ